MKSHFQDTEIIGFWADAFGPLLSCTALATISVHEGINRISMKSGSVIPSGADRLMLYQIGDHGISEEYVIIELSEGCAYPPDDEPLYEFEVISDTQIRAEWGSESHFNLQRAFQDISAVSRDSIAVIINGDMTNSGVQEEYDVLMRELTHTPGMPETYMSIGNHEYMSGEDADISEERFLQYAYLPDGTHPSSVYYDFYLGSAHFIVLAPDCVDEDSVVWCGAEQLEWLEDTIANTPDDSEIFVFLHEAIQNTVSGSYPEQGWGSYQDDGELLQILKKRDDVILFTSHTHWTMNDQDTIYQDEGLTVLNTAAVGYLWQSNMDAEGEYLPGSQGYFVRVFPTYVEIFGRDFTTRKWIPSAMFVLSKS